MIAHKTAINNKIMNNKNLLNALIKAQSDEEATKIINGIKNAVWKEYGGNGDNIATIHGQMDDPLRCLAENIVNGIDSIKMLAVRKAGIDFSNPDKPDPRLPQSSQEAIEKYVGIKKPLHKLKAKEKEQMVGIYFERLKPSDSCVQIYDYGEGQRPDAFDDTLLSLGRGNKASLPFVQGKYNQGSTGVLKKCNGHRYELIVSMRNLALDDADNKIGFTMVRYANDVKHNKKYRSYEYLTINGEIPYVMYSEDMLNFFSCVPNFKGGCIRKLYSYNVGKPCDFHVATRINALFYNTGIPIKATVPRMREKNEVMESYWLGGIKDKISESKTHTPLLHKVANIVTYCTVSDENGVSQKGPFNVKAEYYVFPHHNSLHTTIINGHSISFIDGGQNNGDMSKTFVSDVCKMNQVAKNIMIFIHTDEIPSQFVIDMYKPSRDRIDDKSKLAEDIISQLKDILVHDKDLRKINEELKGATAQSLNTDELRDSIQDSLMKNQTLARMFNSQNGQKLKDMAGCDDDFESTGDNEKDVTKHHNVAISLKPDETKEFTMTYDMAYGVELDLEGAKDINIEDMNGIIVNIRPIHLKYDHIVSRGKSVPRMEPSNTYSKTIESGKLKLLVNPKTMGYFAEEQFEISFNHVNDENFNAVVQISVVEKQAVKRNRKSKNAKWQGPQLYLAAKNPAVDGVLSWAELSQFNFDENVTCRLIEENHRLERIYINLDFVGYEKLISKGINNDTAKNNYIESVYIDAVVDYTTLVYDFLNKFGKDSETFSEVKDVMLDFILEETERMNSNRKCV